MQIYDKMARDIEQHLQHVMGVPATNPLYAQMTNLLETVLHARNSRDIQTAIALLQKVWTSHSWGLADRRVNDQDKPRSQGFKSILSHQSSLASVLS